jgi:FtsH-binding integral membrane protein
MDYRSMSYPRPGALPAASERASDALWVTYRWMTLGLAATGLTAMGIASWPAAIDFVVTNRAVLFVLFIAQLGLVMGLGAAATRVSTPVAAGMFFLYAVLTGVTFSTLFLVYTATSIATAFFVSAGAFGGLSFYGAVTRRDLSAIGRFAMFAVIGLFLALIANWFLHSTGLNLLISLAGVGVFAALTAYDTQRLKTLFMQAEPNANWPVVGALMLYLDFINLFLFLLRLMGDRRRD